MQLPRLTCLTRDRPRNIPVWTSDSESCHFLRGKPFIRHRRACFLIRCLVVPVSMPAPDDPMSADQQQFYAPLADSVRQSLRVDLTQTVDALYQRVGQTPARLRASGRPHPTAGSPPGQDRLLRATPTPDERKGTYATGKQRHTGDRSLHG